jgi:hypothetical protein
MNALDRLKSYISPSLAASIAEHRAREKAFLSYEAANQAPRTRENKGQTRGWYGDKGESKALGQADRQSMIREISDLYRNDGGLVSTMLDRLTDHVVGVGILPQFRTDNEAWNDDAEAYMRMWSENSDFEGRDLPFFGEGQKLLIMDLHLRGGSFLRTLETMQLQWMEYEMCRNPLTMPDQSLWDDGVFIPGGQVKGYNFQIQPGTTVQDVFSSASGVVHAHAPFFRARQRKGIPVLANIVPRMQQIVSTTEAMQLKVLLEAQQTIKFTGKGSGGQILNDMPLGSTLTSKADDNFVAIKTDKGTWYDLPEDRDVAAVESRTPSGEHIPYMNRQEVAACARCGIPYSIAMMLAGASYAATRGELLVFEHTKLRLWNYVVRASQRVTDWVIADAIARRFLAPAPTRTMNGYKVSDQKHVEWSVPAQMSLSPLEVEKVWDAKYARGGSTITEILKATNKELKDVWDERQREITDAIERAKSIQDATGVPVDYTIFFNAARPGAGNPNAGLEMNKADQEISNEPEPDFQDAPENDGEPTPQKTGGNKWLK